MHAPSDDTLVQWQHHLEERLRTYTGISRATERISEPDVHTAATAYVTRPSKRLLGLAFLHAAHTLRVTADPEDLLAVAMALEIRHGAILLHDDIVDRDAQRGGHPTAHHALRPVFGDDEAASAALLAGDVLAALEPLPILDTTLPAPVKAQLLGVFQETTALVAAGQVEQLHLDVCRAPDTVDELEILRVHSGQFAPYLLCSIQLACVLANLDARHIDRVIDAGVPVCQGFQVQNDLHGFRELTRMLRAGAGPGVETQVLRMANTSDLARRRRTVLVRAALYRLQGTERARLNCYLAGSDDDLATAAGLVESSGAPEHCARLVDELHAEARHRITKDPALPQGARAGLSETWRYMTDLYDAASPVSRLYLRARPDLQAAIS